MNPHAAHSTSLRTMLASIWGNRMLIWQLSKREVASRYKGSWMGLLWSFLNPLLMLVVYTFFFSVVFKSRWGATPSGSEESKTMFAVLLFVGMIVHSLFAEVLSKAPHLILSNTNYVKKVVFPLEILPIVSMGTALFHGLVSTVVLLLVYVVTHGTLHWTVLLLPLIMFPLVILTVGLAWMLSSLGVYVRDVAQTIGLAMTVMLFLSPVFYPVSALPAALQPWMLANPLTFIIEQARLVLVWGQLPNWLGVGLYTILASVVAWLGFVWFQKTRKGFADVL